MFTSHTRHTEYLTHLVVFAVLFFLNTTFAFAADEKFVPMAHLPGITGDAVPLPVYINRIYMLTITIGAFIGVIKLSIAGVKYAMSDVVTDKSSAKKDIMGVFLGLAILLVPFIVLKQINPDLVNLELLRNASKVDTTGKNPGINSPYTGSNYPTSGFYVDYISINMSNDAIAALTEQQKQILNEKCADAGGSITKDYGCLKKITVTCAEGQYFVESQHGCR